MKKFLQLALVCFVAVVLFGCGGKATKTCSMTSGSANLQMIAEAPSKDGDVTTVEMIVTMSYDDLGITQDDLTDDITETVTSYLETTLFSSFGVEEGEGVTINTNGFDDDGYTLDATIDIEQLKTALGAGDNEDVSLDSFVEEMENEGMTCE